MSGKPTSAKSTRITTVQVPGETPPANGPETSQPQGGQQASSDSAKPEVTMADVGLHVGPGTAIAAREIDVDLDALRERIRAEEHAKLMAELNTQVRAAQTVVEAGSAQAAPSRSGRDYRNLHAHQVDPKTLTAPVLTKDGWVCPDVPATAKAKE